MYRSLPCLLGGECHSPWEICLLGSRNAASNVIAIFQYLIHSSFYTVFDFLKSLLIDAYKWIEKSIALKHNGFDIIYIQTVLVCWCQFFLKWCFVSYLSLLFTFCCLVIIFNLSCKSRWIWNSPVRALCRDKNVDFASSLSIIFLCGYIYRTRCFANPFWMNLQWRWIAKNLLTTLSSRLGCCLFSYLLWFLMV